MIVESLNPGKMSWITFFSSVCLRDANKEINLEEIISLPILLIGYGNFAGYSYFGIAITSPSHSKVDVKEILQRIEVAEVSVLRV